MAIASHIQLGLNVDFAFSAMSIDFLGPIAELIFNGRSILPVRMRVRRTREQGGAP